jgi:hypothetical protein
LKTNTVASQIVAESKKLPLFKPGNYKSEKQI